MSTGGTVELRRARPLLGTIVEIHARGNDAEQLACALHHAFSAIERTHRLMSFQSAASDVTRLNRRAWKQSLRVHPWTFAVLQAALRIAAASGGRFDISVAAALVRARRLPHPRGARMPSRTADFRDVVLRPGLRVRFRRPLWIDLSGIAKGYAVDRAVRALQRAGVSAGVVNAGGDLRVFGREPILVHVRDPGRPQRLLPLAQLRAGALATSAASGPDASGALVDPRRRRLVVNHASATVVATRCVDADAWAKVALLAGPGAPGLRRAGAQARVLHACAQADACA